MTARELALRLARCIGLTSFDPDDGAGGANILSPGVTPGVPEDLVTAINGALQEIWAFAPSTLRHRRVGSFLRAPTPVTLAVTQYSAAVAIAGFESWMVGCSLRIGGETIDNAIRAEDELLRPYLGPSASGVAATVYHDCVTLGAGQTELFGPVEIPQVRRLIAAGSRAEFECYDVAQVGGDDYGRIWAKLHASARQPAQPWAYFVDAEEGSGGPVTRLRVLPIPDALYALDYSVRTAPPSVSTTDILLTVPGGEDPAVTFPLPEGWDESVLLPLALRRFSAHPAFGTANGVSVSEINRQAATAMGILHKWGPGRAAGRMQASFR